MQHFRVAVVRSGVEPHSLRAAVLQTAGLYLSPVAHRSIQLSMIEWEIFPFVNQLVVGAGTPRFELG